MKINIHAKCNDCCFVSVPELELERSDYVPRNMNIGGGDTIELTIDNETGKIEGWIPLTKEQIIDELT